MMAIRCLIVDDEPMAQEILKRFIEDDNRLALIHVCSNAFEANKILEKDTIELLFLDINMPKLDGLAFYKTLPSPPLVIFTTAYPEFAVDGFEVNAVDYLLKPFTFERFIKAVNKVVELSKQHNDVTDTFILLSADKKIHKIELADILYLKSQGDYVQVFLTDSSLIVHETLSNLFRRLPDSKFAQVHKSYIVSVNKFDYIEGNMLIIGKTSIPIGNSYRTSFLTLIKKI